MDIIISNHINEQRCRLLRAMLDDRDIVIFAKHGCEKKCINTVAKHKSHLGANCGCYSHQRHCFRTLDNKRDSGF